MISNKELADYIISNKKNILETIEDYATNITYDTLKELVEKYGYKLYDNAACIDVKFRPNITFDVEKELNISKEQFFDFLYNSEIPNFAEDLSLSFDNFVVHGRMGGYWGLDNAKENVELTEKFAEDLASEILGDSVEYWVEYRSEYVDDFRNLDPDELVYDYIKAVGIDSNILELNDINYLELNKEYLSDLKLLSDDIDFMEKEWNEPDYWGDKYWENSNESLRIRKTMTLNEDIQKILEENVKIKTKNPGILEIPEGKNFWDLPLKHYKELVDKKGYAKVIRALTNLEVWNKNDNPDISKKASDIADKLKKFYKKESFNEQDDYDEICEIVVFGALPTIKEKIIEPFNFINSYEIYTGDKRAHDGVLLYIPEDEVVGFEQFLQENNFKYANKDDFKEEKIMTLNEDIQRILEEDSSYFKDGSYINPAISMVLNEKLDDLESKIKNIRKEIRKTFPNTPILDPSNEIIEQIKDKYNEIYSLINAAVKSIDEIPNKLK